MVYLLIGAFGEFWSNASELVCVLRDDDPVRAVPSVLAAGSTGNRERNLLIFYLYSYLVLVVCHVFLFS